MKVQYFSKNTIAEGFDLGEFGDVFRDMSTMKRKRLIKLMARIMEMGYRRGAQQILRFKTDNMFLPGVEEKISKGHLRYNISLDLAPMHDAGYYMPDMKTSLKRLEAEHGATLRALGIYYF